MNFLIHFILITCAVSLDGFAVGLSYGLRKMNITQAALIIIMLCSGIIVFSSMTIGTMIRQFISPSEARYVGGIIFICLGLFLFLSTVRSSYVRKKRTKQLPSYSSFLKDPTIVDIDRSGTISLRESFILGIALALDAFGAGFAAAMLGYAPFITAITIAFTSGLFLYLGINIGMVISKIKWTKQLTFIPSIILIVIGVTSFF